MKFRRRIDRYWRTYRRKLTAWRYRCWKCKGVFDKGWTDEQAKAEALQLWGVYYTPRSEDLVCDPCFRKMGY